MKQFMRKETRKLRTRRSAHSNESQNRPCKSTSHRNSILAPALTTWVLGAEGDSSSPRAPPPKRTRFMLLLCPRREKKGARPCHCGGSPSEDLDVLPRRDCRRHGIGGRGGLPVLSALAVKHRPYAGRVDVRLLLHPLLQHAPLVEPVLQRLWLHGDAAGNGADLLLRWRGAELEGGGEQLELCHVRGGRGARKPKRMHVQSGRPGTGEHGKGEFGDRGAPS